ncbi:MAG: 1-acyl-sn-glycerol-3-phosphate acyltransferase [Actinomycetota bacterium]|nr:1-acyl-sn-glycerol-3-phosphate acyltransferase [Actinomycetota bacterium]
MAPPRAVRRALMPVVVALELAALALMMPLAVVGILTAPLDRRRRILRLAAMGGAYLSVELVALGLLLGTWVRRPVRDAAVTRDDEVRILGWALDRILAAARRTVGLRIALPPVPPGSVLDGRDPVLVLARHGGVGDSYTLVWLLAARFGRCPRVVLKRVLLWEPLIDVALSRLGACFLPPSTRAGPGRQARVGALAADLRPGDALLLFPEGGNWTPHRRLAGLARQWAARKPEAVRAAALMEHVLLPRLGGVTACLEARPALPVVVVAHTGLDTITSARGLWRALPFSAPMAIRWWPAAAPPPDGDERLAWLTTEWAVVDQWIDARRAGRPV